jgi:hypothetical protein
VTRAAGERDPPVPVYWYRIPRYSRPVARSAEGVGLDVLSGRTCNGGEVWPPRLKVVQRIADIVGKRFSVSKKYQGGTGSLLSHFSFRTTQRFYD